MLMYIFILLSLKTTHVYAIEPNEANDLCQCCEQSPNSAFTELQKLNTAIICNQNFSTKWSHKKEAKEWTKTLCESLATEGANLFNSRIKDIKSYCPNYENLKSIEQKMQFWIMLLTEIASFETINFNTNEMGDVRHFGRENASIGLFQMSHRDNCPGINSNEDLTNASKNIRCAVYKLNQLISSDQVIASKPADGAARYWGPLREPKGAEVEISKLSAKEMKRYNCVGKKCISKREQIKRNTRDLNICRVLSKK